MTEKSRKPVFKIQNRIVTKSLLRVLCILLPLVFLFHYISQFGSATQSRIEAERQNLEFSNRMNRAASLTALSSAYLVINLLMNSEKSAQGFSFHRREALEEIRQLESFSKQIVDPGKSSHVATLIEQTYKALDTWAQMRPAGSTNEIRDVVTNMKSMRSFFIKLFQLHMRFQKIEIEEQARLVQAIEQGKADLASINQILYVALALLFSLSIYLVHSFSREITDRLKIVVENATRLPQREKLNRHVSGGDEISYLDSVLHQAADKLEQSAQFRKSLLEMVAHDMCSPLTAVNLSLAILQKGTHEESSESTAEKFKDAPLRIEQLVLKAKSLLSIERLCASLPDLGLADAEVSGQHNLASEDANINELSRLIRIEFRSGSEAASAAAERFRPGIFKKGLVLFLAFVDALLTIENLEQGKIELAKTQFAARHVAQDAIVSLTALAQDRKVALTNDCQDIRVNADRDRVIQVLVNFLGNVISHSPPETTVRIEASQTPRGVRFDVIDSGPGLSGEMRNKVFERFFQTEDSKTKGKGYGLGLAICKMIAEAHDGSVCCDEASTGGCSFYAVFPTLQK